MVSPKDIFDNAWERCDVLTNAYAFTSSNMTGVFQSDELLRAEWVARVSALDLYIHELVSQEMLNIFKKTRSISKGYETFTLPHRIIDIIRDESTTSNDAENVFNLEVRRQLGFQTYQNSSSIADGIRLISDVELWNTIAANQGEPARTCQTKAKAIKLQLNTIVDRRNKIAHEGDMQPIMPRTPWPITNNDLITVRSFISSLINSLESII